MTVTIIMMTSRGFNCSRSVDLKMSSEKTLWRHKHSSCDLVKVVNGRRLHNGVIKSIVGILS